MFTAPVIPAPADIPPSNAPSAAVRGVVPWRRLRHRMPDQDRWRRAVDMMNRITRSEVSGIRYSAGTDGVGPAAIARETASTTSRASQPVITMPPVSSASGRSIDSRSVTAGNSRIADSSAMVPESDSAHAAPSGAGCIVKSEWLVEVHALGWVRRQRFKAVTGPRMGGHGDRHSPAVSTATRHSSSCPSRAGESTFSSRCALTTK